MSLMSQQAYIPEYQTAAPKQASFSPYADNGG